MKTEALEYHKQLHGQLEVTVKKPMKTQKDISLAYTPGVAFISDAIAKNKNAVYDYTIKHNSLAVITDGSAVLGLGNIGPEAALPVMEGKAALFKQFGNIDAFPICLATQDTEEIIRTIKNIAPVFGAINLEDISAPRCFEIEERLQDLGIPVMHDDQQGTAIVVLAGLINATKVVHKTLEQIKIVINGAGAAGTAIAKLLVCMDYDAKICRSAGEVIVCDTEGMIYEGRPAMNKYKQQLAKITNHKRMRGTLADALKGADVFIGVSKAHLVTEAMVKTMNTDAIIFAMANPVPEIMPDEAKKAGATIIATGRSDFPNQVNNALVFPGLFRGALDMKAKNITQEMKLRAAHALAATVQHPTKDKILPSLLDKQAADNIARAVRRIKIFD
jgi:malate dehydrogenase (oxaloacetate-decarboxylating)